MIPDNIHHFPDRAAFREWLSEHHDSARDVWVVFRKKGSGNPGVETPSLIYNDAVEESLCFGWIDSIVKKLDDQNRIQRFSPRRRGSTYSQPNRERLMWLAEHNLIHPSMQETVDEILREPFNFPDDILAELRRDETAWAHYQSFSESYRRIRIAWIDAARDRPEEFRKRLDHFIKKTRENKRIGGYGGVDKYY